MLTIKSLGTCDSAEKISYYTEIASIDYYEVGYEPDGVWLGNLAGQFKLKNKTVTHQNLMQFAQGFSLSGKALVENAGEKHFIGQDFCLSAIKHMSVLAGLSSAKQRKILEKCHDTAVERTLKYAEKHLLETRIGFDKYGKRQRVTTNKMLAAVFRHSTSRLNDPNFHSHCLLLNLTYQQGVGYRCVESKKLFQYQKALGVMYRNELAFQLKTKLKLEIEPDGEFFKLPIVPDELCKKFSKRSESINESIAKKALLNTSTNRQRAALFSRDKKQNIPREELYKKWADEAGNWKPIYPTKMSAQDKTLEDYKQEILQELVTYQSVFKHSDIVEVTHRYAQWLGAGINQTLKFEQALLAEKELIKIPHPEFGTVYTTQSQVDLENEFYNTANQLLNQSNHKFTLDQLPKHFTTGLNKEQQTAFNGIVDGGDLSLLNGLPGTGKSYLMKAVNQIYKENDYQVIGCALAGKAAAELQQGSGIKSQTIDSLWLALERKPNRLTKNTLLVIDETGMCGVKKLNQLIQAAKSAGSKVILVGDENQLQPIESGSAFHQLVRNNSALELQNIQRQKDKEDRDNVIKIRDGKLLEVLQNLESRGLMYFDTCHTHAKAQLVNDWFEHYETDNNNSLIIASTKADVHELNIIARQKLRMEEAISSISIPFKTEDNKALDLSVGDRVMFTSNSYQLNVKNGNTGTINEIETAWDGSVNLTITLADGRAMSFNSKTYNSLDYGYASSVHKAQGMTVDRAFLYLTDRFISKELAFVQLSRSRFESKVYLANSLLRKEDYISSISLKAETRNDYSYELLA